MSTTEGNKTPDEIRRDIESTRGHLGSDVDALADKVNPSSIAHRQTEKVKGKFTSIKESLMGSVDDAHEAGSSAADALKDAPQRAANAAKGNAIAVGLVAFGVGLLLSSLVPASEREQELATAAKEKAAPAIDAVKSAAQDVAQNLKEPAKEAFDSVKDSAQDAGETVRDEARSAAADVKGRAEEARDTIQNQ
jgi:gas vesicle protein